ncbi:hypothetical protein C496_17037 [Natronorubrum tibetense GA33]|uniref:Uncharacterized protein n=1 Tax=Natronorubrum tibetense GA33 TaxID=1114856 RepID=L9VQ27_9EURY|nr:hypothetical protein C496_17037 [Natronorubrum tibetense GA33]
MSTRLFHSVPTVALSPKTGVTCRRSYHSSRVSTSVVLERTAAFDRTPRRPTRSRKSIGAERHIYVRRH